MTDALTISLQKTSHSKLANTDLENPVFGKMYSDHMFIADFADGEWKDLRIIPYGDISISPANTTLHYASTIFEGLKAYRNKEGEVLIFRPEANAARMRKSAARMCMPEIPEEIFMQGMMELLAIDKNWVPSKTGTSLYIRPLQIAMDPFIGIRPSDTYTFYIITGPVGAYYSRPVKVKIETKYTRAAAGGTGFAKTGGNYAAALYPAVQAQKEGYDQLIWTDGISHEFVEESGTMNLLFIIEDTLVTAPTGDTILPGITRDSILTLARDHGMKVEERPITVKEVISGIESGKVQEAFGAGTAATIAKIQTIGYEGKDYDLVDAGKWQYAPMLLQKLEDIKLGRVEDPYGWVTRL
jgi:branched-chain amino acid aminotransferase